MRTTVLRYETKGVVDAAREGKRLDGRKLDEMRDFSIELDISKNAEGSASIRLGETHIISGIKMLPSKPYSDSPDEGSIAFSCELLPLSHSEYEYGAPSPIEVEFGRVVDRGIRESKAIDLKALNIRKGELGWTAFIDFYAVNSDGNLIDAGCIACLAALIKSRVPVLDENDQVVKGEYKGSIKLARIPIQSTFVKIAGKILLDPTYLEEKAAEARFSIATTDDGYMSSFQKGIGGSFTSKEVEDMIEIAEKVSKEIRKKLLKL